MRSADPDTKPPPRLIGLALRPFQQFAETGALGGIVLLAATAIALAWANSPWHASYGHLWERPLAIGPAGAPLVLSLHHWINDALMSVFFLLVGLEIKRELLVGELASPRQAALPIAAAAGGMVVPALLYALLNPGGPGAAGWGIPMATDIAFALCVLALLGPRIPLGLKVFLAALAIVDDMGAVLVIALFYASGVAMAPLGAAAAALALLVLLNRLGVRAIGSYLLAGLVLWWAVHASGIHATVAGVLLALTIPSRTRMDAAQFATRARGLLDEFERAETGDLLIITSKGQQEAIYGLQAASAAVQAPLLRLEHALHGVVAYGVMPLFALANAGVRLEAADGLLGSPVTRGVLLGLLLGKPLGITLFAWLAVRLRLATLPAGVGWRGIHGATWLGGIGFTMSLFVASLAFGGLPLLDAAKVGVLAASFGAAVVGSTLLLGGRLAPPRVA